MSTTSLKLPDDVKQLAAEAAKTQGITPHAFMVSAIRDAATAAAQRAEFMAEALAADLGVAIPELATALFEAKSDISAFSDAALLRMDSKEYTVAGKELRVSVLETTAPKLVLDRKDSLMAAMVDVAKEDGADQVLLFVVDILNEEATLLVPNDLVRTLAEKSFGATVTGDTVVLPGIMSRKKQIIPALTL